MIPGHGSCEGSESAARKATSVITRFAPARNHTRLINMLRVRETAIRLIDRFIDRYPLPENGIRSRLFRQFRNSLCESLCS